MTATRKLLLRIAGLIAGALILLILIVAAGVQQYGEFRLTKAIS